MKRFEMIIMIILMWAGAETGDVFGISNELNMVLAVAAYVILVAIVKYFSKGFRIMVIKNEG